jgi:hypothetical protein
MTISPAAALELHHGLSKPLRNIAAVAHTEFQAREPSFPIASANRDHFAYSENKSVYLRPVRRFADNPDSIPNWRSLQSDTAKEALADIAVELCWASLLLNGKPIGDIKKHLGIAHLIPR